MMNNSSNITDEGGGSSSEPPESAGAKPRNPLDKLSKEELLTKCKNLIVIAQKAKAAKDEAVTELQKLKENSGRENEALLEMVDNLTEGKVALITKTESLQRQLNLSASELQAAQSVQDRLLQEKQQALEQVQVYQAKIARKKERFEKNLLAERERNEQLLGKIENLEAQTSQIEVLKTKCKKLLDEKSKWEETTKQAKAILAEKKANEIILEESKNRQKQLEETTKQLTTEIKQLRLECKEKQTRMDDKEKIIDNLKHELTVIQESKEINDEGEYHQNPAEADDGKEVIITELKCKTLELEKKCDEYERILSDIKEKGEATEITEEITECVTVSDNGSSMDEILILRARINELERALVESKPLHMPHKSIDYALEQSEALVNELREKIEKHEEEKNNLEQMVFDANEKYALYDGEIQALKAQTETQAVRIIATSEENERLKQELLVEKNSNRELAEQLKRTQTKNYEDESAIVNLNQEIETLQQSLRNTERALKNDLTAAEDMLAARADKMTALEDKVALLTKNLEKLENENKLHLDKIASLLNEVQNESACVKDTTESLETMREENKKLTKTVENYASQIQSMEHRLSCITENFKLCFCAEDSKFPAVSSILSQNLASDISAEGKEDDLLGQMNAILLAFEKQASLNSTLQKANEDKISDLKSHIDALKNYKHELLNQIITLRDTTSKDAEEIRIAHSEALELSAQEKMKALEEVALLQHKLNSFECSSAETSALQEQVELGNKEIVELKDKLRVDNEDFVRKLQGLEMELKQERELKESLNEKLAEIEDEVKATGMKIQDDKDEFLKQIDNLSKENEQLSCKWKALEEECEDLKRQREEDLTFKEEMEKEVSEVKNFLKEKEQTCEDLKSKVQELEESITEKNHELLSRKHELQILRDQLALSSESSEETARKFTELECKLFESKSRIETLEKLDLERQVAADNVKQELEKVRNEFEAKLGDLQTENSNLTCQLEAIKEEKNRCNEDLRHKIAEMSSLKAENDFANEKLRVETAEKNELDSKLKSVLEEKENLSSKVSELREKILAVEQENERLILEMSQAELEDEQKVEALSSEKEAMSEKFVAIETENVNNLKKLKQAHATNERLTEQLRVLQERNVQSSQIIHDLENSKIELHDKLKKLEEDNISNLKASEVAKELEEKLKYFEEASVNNEEKLHSLKQKSDELISENAALKERLLNASQDSEKFTPEIVALNAEREKLLQKAEMYVKQNEELAKKSDELVKENEELTKKSDELVKKNEELTEKKNELVKENEELTKKSDGLVEKNEELTKKSDELVKKNEELTVTSEICLKELSAKSDECKQLEEELQALKTAHEQAKERLVKEERELKAANEQVTALTAQCKECSDALQTQTAALQEGEVLRAQLDVDLSVAQGRAQELLHEMNDVTKVLRERGERISRLEATLKQRTEEVDAARAKLQSIEEQFTSSEAAREALIAELDALRRQTSAANEPKHQPQHLKQQPQHLEQEPQHLEQQPQHLEQLQNRLTETTLEKEALLQKILHLEEQITVTSASSAAAVANEAPVASAAAPVVAVAAPVASSTAPVTSSSTAPVTSSAETPVSSVAVASAVVHTASVPPTTGATDCPSEVMSTSTMSKAEEANRLKDIEDTFEERYMKLKSVAIKLKKKLAEQTVQINALEEQKTKLLAEKEQLGPARAASKNIQVLQAEVDRLQDAVESGTRAIKEKDGQLTQAAQQISSCKDQLVQQTQQIDNLKATVKTLEEANTELQTRETGLLADMKALQEQASGLVEQDNKEKSLEAQLEHLTAQHAADEGTTQHLRKSNEELRSRLAEVEKEVIELRVLKQQLSAEAERLRQVIEDQKVSVTEVSQTRSHEQELARRTAARNAKQIASLEERVSALTTELQQTSDELIHVRKEFDCYKARAQSVLKQQQKQKTPSVDVEELQQRLQLGETKMQTLQHSNRHLQSELSALQSEHKFVQGEKERLLKQHRQEAEASAAQVAALEDEKNKLEEKIKKITSDSQSLVAKMAAEGEAMVKSYEAQLKSLACVHERELSELQTQLDASVLRASAAPPSGHGETKASSAQHRRLDSADDAKVDVTTMIREAGEGSEWVEPTPSHRPGVFSSPSAALDADAEPYQSPPLHQLLSSHSAGLSLHSAGSFADDAASLAGSATDHMPDQSSYVSSQLSAMQAKLDAYEVRMEQVTVLLHESEAENAKLSQLTDALKEEIRRGSRNHDREKHLENLEYLKNVVLQFITLGDSGSDGRERLLPVLTTLLQLAPHEVAKIKSVVHGEGEGAAASQGWGSYLHLWSAR
ncbi:GRIP and coiled-coil domain-containing protein 2 [Hyalella azteca]|uniref:GRIP and coiled-coil domain-containing protein 2 n=1 Tax=Hyalella azteca TaxID=294128 RepID=A0A979FXL5_HYAAZ|nr:GRIP and coiled-coil domain-containing protein 2 [Hyalella azteca]